MRSFQFDRGYRQLMTADIVLEMARIHEHKGAQRWYLKSSENILPKLSIDALKHSIEAACFLENKVVPVERLNKLAKDKASLLNDTERYIAGYRDAVLMINLEHDYIEINYEVVLQNLSALYKFVGGNTCGVIKSHSQTICFGDAGERFETISAWEAQEALSKLCREFCEASSGGEMDPLLLVPMFALDFLCIQPFAEMNYSVCLLLVRLLLLKAGYGVEEFFCLEKLIPLRMEACREAFRLSTKGWHEGKNDYGPFVRIFLGWLRAAYEELEYQAGFVCAGDVKTPDRIRRILRETDGSVTKMQLVELCKDLSAITVQRALIELQKSGEVKKISGGRYTAYTWNRNRDL